jgi:predicted transglutaminase-like cysteine proteinase
MSDSEQFGVPEWWSEARSGFDDCDGYALLKRALLKEQGFDELCIHIATFWINVKADNGLSFDVCDYSFLRTSARVFAPYALS